MKKLIRFIQKNFHCNFSRQMAEDFIEKRNNKTSKLFTDKTHRPLDILKRKENFLKRVEEEKQRLYIKNPNRQIIKYIIKGETNLIRKRALKEYLENK